MMTLKELKNMDGDSLLGAFGVQRRGNADWVAPAIGALVVGAILGAVSALLLAPQSGEELRGDLRKRLNEAKELNPMPETKTNTNSRRPLEHSGQ